MRSALVGALAAGVFDPVAVVGPSQQTAPIPAGAVSVSYYFVGVGGDGVGGLGDAGASGDGGGCYWRTDVAIPVGATGIMIDFTNAGLYWSPSNAGLQFSFNNRGGAGVAQFSSTGGAAATEIAPGLSGGSDANPGPVSVTAGSVLAGYVGHGGDKSSAYNGVGWGAGGGVPSHGLAPGFGGPAGALFIFK